MTATGCIAAMPTTRTTIIPRGSFSVAAAADFLGGFAPAGRPDAAGPGPLRLGFVVEGEWAPAGAAVTQDPDGTVHAELTGPADPGAAAAQLARVLSLDVDGSGLGAVARRDPVVGDLVARYPGLRPVCFGSPYEAAAWAVLSQRVRIRQAAVVQRRLVADHGTAVGVAGADLPLFPAPVALHAAAHRLGLPSVKAERLQAVAAAAMDGTLDAARLRSLPVETALAELRGIPGIGPFSSELVLVRGAGHPDVFPATEGRLHAEMARAYQLDGPAPTALAGIAQGWQPYRSWVALLLRADRERRTHEIGG